MSIKHTLCSLALVAALPSVVHAATEKFDAQAAINQLNGSVASAEQTILDVRTGQAFAQLEAGIAEMELTLVLASADEAIKQVRGQEAINQLMASVADAEIGISLAQANEVIQGVSDMQMLAELDSSLLGSSAEQANDLIMAVVSERPMLASMVEGMATGAGLDDALVASAVFSGLASAPATAAGQ